MAATEISAGGMPADKKEADGVMGPILPIIKNANYLGKTFATRIMQIPLKYGGYGIPDMYVFSVMEQAKMLLSSLRTRDNTGKKMKMLIEYHQMESGMETSILKADGTWDFLLTESWVTKLVKSLREMGLWIEAEHWVPRVEGEEDGTIMNNLIQIGLGQEDLEKANLCRMHFEMLWVGDMYDMEGRLRTNGSKLEGSHSVLDWPRTPVPLTWKKWWWEKLGEWFPGRKREVTWHARRTNARATSNGARVRYNGRVYKSTGGRTRRGI